MTEWTINICEKCNKPHQGHQHTSCIVEFDSAGDTLAPLKRVRVVSKEEVAKEFERLRDIILEWQLS